MLFLSVSFSSFVYMRGSAINKEIRNQEKERRGEVSGDKARNQERCERMGTSVKAVAIIAGDPNVRGSLQFVQNPNGITHIEGRITGLTPGLHGFHVHALGDTTNGCNSTGPHFNPLKKHHGAPSDDERHAGDLGNIVAGPDGVAEISIKDMQIPLSGKHSILGRAVVVHADPDDLGRGGHELSKSTGNAGARVGCGIIGLQSFV